MDTSIWIAGIELLGTIIAVVITSKATRDTVTQQLSTNQAVTQNEIDHIKKDMDEMKADIKEHNHYSRMFTETVPVLQEQMKAVNNQIEDLKRSIK